MMEIDQKGPRNFFFLRKYLLLSELLMYSVFSRVSTRFFDFKTILGLLGLKLVEDHSISLDNNDYKRLSLYIDFLSKNLPWRFLCLEKAISVSLYLKFRKVPHMIYFGVNNTKNGLAAHAWLKVGQGFVTGGEGVDDYTVMAVFR